MTAIQLADHKGYQNVMEFLVAEEVERQLNALSPKLAMYIRCLEVQTYALNRLPSLYASSERGWQYQRQKAEVKFQQNIITGVRQAFSAVQTDPLRRSKPLSPEAPNAGQESSESEAALQALRDLLQQSDLSWTGVVEKVKNLLAEQPQQQPLGRSACRPGTHGKGSWQRKSQPSQPKAWNNPLYCQ